MPSGLPDLTDLPPGYVVWREPRGVAAVSERHAAALTALGVTATEDGTLERSDLHGRRPLLEYRLADTTLVVRRFHHGGLLRWATGARFRDPARPFDELRVTEALRAAGFRAPHVAGARARKAPGGGYHLELWTERIEGACDVAVLLEDARRGALAFPARARLAAALGSLVARLHAFGLAHPDLQPRNLLIDRNELEEAAPLPEPWVLDLDRAELASPPDDGPALTEAQRRHNLRRLFRSVARRSAEGSAPFLTRGDLARFAKAYAAAAARAPHGAFPCDWRADWRAIEAAHARRGLAHRVTRSLERRFGDDRARLGRE